MYCLFCILLYNIKLVLTNKSTRIILASKKIREKLFFLVSITPHDKYLIDEHAIIIIRSFVWYKKKPFLELDDSRKNLLY